VRIAARAQSHKETPGVLLLKNSWRLGAPPPGGKNFLGLRVRARRVFREMGFILIFIRISIIIILRKNNGYK